MHRRHGQDSLPGLYQVGDIIEVWPADVRVLRKPPVWMWAFLLEILDKRTWQRVDEANLPPGHGGGYLFRVIPYVLGSSLSSMLSVTGRDHPKTLQYIDIVKLCESRDTERVRSFCESVWALSTFPALTHEQKERGWQRYLARIEEDLSPRTRELLEQGHADVRAGKVRPLDWSLFPVAAGDE